MKVFGLTGGIGMGKSVVADSLRRKGLPVVDSDALARQLVEKGQPALDEIVRAFGPEILSPEGNLDREALAAKVFATPEKRKQLEAILHPRIRKLWRAQIENWRSQNREAAVAVIPLLFETGAEKEFDKTICVACSARTQRERLAARGWSEDHLQRRLQAQWPIEEKLSRADIAIWNDAGLDVLELQLERVLSAVPS